MYGNDKRVAPPKRSRVERDEEKTETRKAYVEAFKAEQVAWDAFMAARKETQRAYVEHEIAMGRKERIEFTPEERRRYAIARRWVK
jgi:hypothetical protein